MTFFKDPVLHAMAQRRSVSKVEPGAPSDAELVELLAAVTPVADHKGLKPWRLITLRGDDRVRLGAALDEAEGLTRTGSARNPKPLRADLLVAIVCSPTPNPKVPEWEQIATAAGAAHLLELALFQAGWGVMWRSGVNANSEPVRRLHGLNATELLMGWLYVGKIPASFQTKMAASAKPRVPAQQFVSGLPQSATSPQQ